MEVINDSRSRAKVIITIRADFYDKPLLYPRFGELIRTRTELVLPLNEDELEEAISGPATRVGAQIEPGLIQTIKEEVSQEPGALPLLQYALTELFERRMGHKLTLEAYRQIGGTSGALARRAEEVYQSFDPSTQETSRQMFLRLVTLGDGTEDTRRRVLQTELLSISGEQGRMQKAMNTFGRYRLLTFDHDQQSRSATVEVAHEALIRRWERLRSWLDENRESLRLQRRLAAAAEEWRRSNNEKSFLARGVQLQQFEAQIHSGTISLNALESDYLQASIAARDAQIAEEQAREAEEQRREKRERDRLRLFAIAMAILAMSVGVFGVYAVTQRNEAEQAKVVAEDALGEAQRNASEAQSLALSGAARNAQNEGNMPLALTLALDAAKVYDPPVAEVMRVLSTIAYAPGVRYKLANDKGSTISAHFNSDASLFITATADGDIHIRETATGKDVQTLSISDSQVTEALLSPDGSLLAVSLMDGTIRLYDGKTMELVRTLTGHTSIVSDIDFSTDGKRLVSGSEDRTVRLWDVTTGETIHTFTGHIGVVLRVDISSDGSLIASSSADETINDISTDKVERVVKIWEVATGVERLTIEPQSGFVRAITFRPDGKVVAVGVWDGSNRGTIRFYDTINGQEQSRLFAHVDIISDMVYSPDGKTLVSASWDGDVRMWDIRRSLQLMRFVGFNDRILRLDYSADGQYLILGNGNTGNNEFVEKGRDKSAWLIDLKSRDEIRSYTGSTDWVWTVALSPNGKLAAEGTGPLRLPAEGQPAPDTSVRVWDVATNKLAFELKGHTNTVDSVVFLDDSHLISSGWDGKIILWDVTTGQSLRTFAGHTDRIYKLALSPDKTRLLSASADGTVGMWDVASGDLIRSYKVPDADPKSDDFNGVAFAPDGQTFATAGADKMVRVWDANTDRLIMTLSGHAETVNEVLYSPDGTRITSSSWDDTVRLWDAKTGTEVRRITGHNGNTFGLAYIDDRYLLTTSQDTTVRLWDVMTGDELHRFQGHSDWVQEVAVSADRLFILSGAQDRTARVWRLDLTPQQIADFATQNRYSRPLLCQEEEVYRLGTCSAGT
jgi:WD40 repeat protein